MAHLVQVYLPLTANDGSRFNRDKYLVVEETLSNRFAGFTAYPRAPAAGVWKGPDEDVYHDDLLIYEVITDQLDHTWWKEYRSHLEKEFAQDTILVRAHLIDVL